MGLQKYRVDYAGPTQTNGGTPCYTRWIGGPTLALVRGCKIEGIDIPPRTVYVRGEPETYSAIPAVCTYKGQRITGYIATDDHGEYVFRAHIKG
jgi:hypothetical protein